MLAHVVFGVFYGLQGVCFARLVVVAFNDVRAACTRPKLIFFWEKKSARQSDPVCSRPKLTTQLQTRSELVHDCRIPSMHLQALCWSASGRASTSKKTDCKEEILFEALFSWFFFRALIGPGCAGFEVCRVPTSPCQMFFFWALVMQCAGLKQSKSWGNWPKLSCHTCDLRRCANLHELRALPITRLWLLPARVANAGWVLECCGRCLRVATRQASPRLVALGFRHERRDAWPNARIGPEVRIGPDSVLLRDQPVPSSHGHQRETLDNLIETGGEIDRSPWRGGGSGRS